MKLFVRMLLATIVSVSLGTCCSAEAKDTEGHVFQREWKIDDSGM